MPTDSSSSSSVVPLRDQIRDQGAASAGLSLVVPGLGQALQRRWVPAIIHLGAVLTYIFAVREAGWGPAGWFAVAWNVWSAVEAYWYERRHAEPAQPNEELKPPAIRSNLVE